MCGKEQGKDLLRVWGVRDGNLGARVRGGDADMDGDVAFSFCSCACRGARIPSQNLWVTESLRGRLPLRGHCHYYDVDDE